MDGLKKYKYQLEVITPLHISSGDKYYPIDYLQEDRKLYLINQNQLFQDEEFNIDKFVRAPKDNFSWNMFKKSLIKKHSKYQIPIMPDDLRVRKEIEEYIKTGGQPYLPGSSLKGALRTIILMFIMSRKENNELRKYIIKGYNAADKPREVAEELEKNIFGSDPTKDILKGFRVADSQPLSPAKLQINSVKTVQKHSYEWEEKHWNVKTECLSPGSVIKGKLSIDQKLITNMGDSQVVKNISRAAGNLMPLLSKIELYRIQDELTYLEVKGNDKAAKVKDFYNDLETNLKQGQPYLQLGKYAGWSSKTVGNVVRQLDENLFKEIIRNYYRFHTGEFPKTRNFYQTENNKWLPLGWVKVNLEEIS